MAVFLKFFAAACLVFALVIFGYAVPLYVQQYEILQSWPAAEAEVVSSRVVEHASADGPLYSTELRFAFTAKAQPVVGEFVFPHESTSRERKMNQASRFPVGSRQTIRYNPSDPSDVRIRPGYNVEFFVIPVFLTGVALIFVVLAGAFWTAAGWRERRASRVTI